MGVLKSWSEWLAVRESNARKRAVQGALNGTMPPLPGSYAACPSTNARAMKQAQKTGVVSSDPKILQVKEDAKPDYSFDRFLQKTQDLGKDVNAMVDKAKNDEKELDTKLDQEKKNSKDDLDKLKKSKEPEKKDNKPKDGKPEAHEKEDQDVNSNAN